MYYILFGGPDGVAYKAQARTKAESRRKVARLRRDRHPVIVILWDHAPVAVLTRTSRGQYKVRDWD